MSDDQRFPITNLRFVVVATRGARPIAAAPNQEGTAPPLPNSPQVFWPTTMPKRPWPASWEEGEMRENTSVYLACTGQGVCGATLVSAGWDGLLLSACLAVGLPEPCCALGVRTIVGRRLGEPWPPVRRPRGARCHAGVRCSGLLFPCLCLAACPREPCPGCPHHRRLAPRGTMAPSVPVTGCAVPHWPMLERVAVSISLPCYLPSTAMPWV